MGRISFRSKAPKSMSSKNGWSSNVSKPVAPIRFDRSFSKRDAIARRQGTVTAGFVT